MNTSRTVVGHPGPRMLAGGPSRALQPGSVYLRDGTDEAILYFLDFPPARQASPFGAQQPAFGAASGSAFGKPATPAFGATGAFGAAPTVCSLCSQLSPRALTPFFCSLSLC